MYILRSTFLLSMASSHPMQSSASPHFWTSATLLDAQILMPQPSKHSTMLFTAFTPIARYFVLPESERKTFLFHANTRLSIIERTLKILGPRMAFVPPSRNHDILLLLKSHGIVLIAMKR